MFLGNLAYYILTCAKWGATWHLNHYFEVSHQAELKNYVLATIIERYPSDNWLHIYIHVSEEKTSSRAESGIFSTFFQFRVPLILNSDNFGGERFAIYIALKNIFG